MTRPTVSGPARREVLFGRPSGVARAFVSSEMGRRHVLRAERAAAADAIESMPPLRAWLWERDACAGPYSSEVVCVETAATSDVLVLILGRRLTRVTRAEYDAATKAGVPCLIFVKQGAGRDRAVSRFVEEERRRPSITVGFRDPGELRSLVADALRTVLVGALRERILGAPSYATDSAPYAESKAPSAAASPSSAPNSVDARVAEPTEGTGGPGAVADRARDLVRSGAPRQAYELLFDAADDAARGRRPADALLLLSEVRSVAVRVEDLDEVERAWLLNIEGCARSCLGQGARATRLFQRMLAAGERLGDGPLASTALQNLGIQAVLGRRTKDAVPLYLRSLQLKVETEDLYGAAQVILNLSIAVQELEGAGHAAELLDGMEQAIQAIGARDLLVSLHANAGRIAAQQGRLPVAERLLRRALRLSRKDPDSTHRTMIVLQNLGSLTADRGQPDRALNLYDEALSLAPAIDSPRDVEIVRRSRAIVLHRLNRDEEAATEFREAATLADSFEDRSLWAENTANLGAVRLALGEFDVGTAALNEARDEFRALGDKRWQARILVNLSAARQQQGDPAGACRLLLDAVATLPKDDSDERASILRRAGEIEIDAGHVNAAVRLFERELAAVARSDPRAGAWRAAVIGATLTHYGAAPAALAFYTRALAIYARVRDHGLLCRTLNDRALAYADIGRLAAARRDLERCIEIARRRGNRPMRQQALMNLGEMDRRDGRVAWAIRRLTAALRLAEDLEDEHSTAFTLANLGLAFVHAGRWTDADRAYQRALTLARALKDRDRESAVTAGLASIKSHEARWSAAARLYRRSVALCDPADRRHVCEHLAGLAEALAALRRKKELETELQRLVDIAHSSRNEEVAVDALCRCARREFANGLLEEAAGSYEAAIGIGLAAASREIGHDLGVADVKSLVRGAAQPLVEVVNLVVGDVTGPAGGLVDLVVKRAHVRAPGFAKLVRSLLDSALSAMRRARTRPTDNPRHRRIKPAEPASSRGNGTPSRRSTCRSSTPVRRGSVR